MKRKLLLCAIGLLGLAGLPSYGATVETKGFLKYEVYFGPLRGSGLEGNTLDYLHADPNYPNTPDLLSYTKGLTGRGVFSDDTHEQYGLRVSGFLTPTVTGAYNFYIRSDDASQFWISPDATEAGLVNVAEEYACCNPFQEPGVGSQTTATPIPLVAGQKYAIQMLLKEGTGGDWFEVAWQLASGTTPAAQLTPLQSAVLSSMADPVGASLTITQQPADVSTSENVPVSFSVAATAVTPYKKYTGGGTPAMGGAPPLGTGTQVDTFYQWFTNGVEVVGANGPSYAITWPKVAQSGTKVKCYVAVPGIPLFSSEATLTVTADNVKPTVVRAAADAAFTNIVIKYSEPVTDTALATANYAVDQGVTVLGASRIDTMTVQLRTSTMAEGKTYKLTINNVQDTATPGNPITANTLVDVRSFVFLSGTILHKKYDGVADGDGNTADKLFSDVRFPNAPNRQDLLSMWEYPPNGQGRVAADPQRNYFDTIEGFFIPPTTGDYVFLTAGADRWWLYLSTDENPANKKLIAAQPGGWTNPRNWLTGQSTDVTPHRSDTYPGSQWEPANLINLVAGRKYYMLEVHHDPSWCGADDFAATYKLASENDPADGDAPRLTGSVIGFYFDPTGASVTFTAQPQNVTIIQGASATLTAAATGQTAYGTTVLYQWQAAPKGSSTWTDIVGATGASFTTPFLTLANDGVQYRVIATAPPVSQTSSVAVVTVTGDAIPPVATAGAMTGATAGTVELGVAFNEPVTMASAGAMANYSLSAGTITSIKVFTNRFTANSQNPLVKIPKHSVLLTATGVGASGTLTVKDVADPFGNKMPVTAIPFTVDTKMKWGIVGGHEFAAENAAVPVAANGWDVYSDGMTEWSSYDEATFVYEPVTGDFDKKLRVEYQDGSSQWARAGLLVRDVLNLGVDRAAQRGSTGDATVGPYDGLAGRHQHCIVTPVGATLTGPGTAGAQDWELNRRLDTGGQTTGPTFTGANAIPQYPNAWCRIQRAGQKFTMFRSNDGVNWVELASTTWGVDDESKTPMPATLYVGPQYAPELGNLTQEADRGVFLARFRDYGDYVAVFQPNLQLNKAPNGKLSISWTTGTLVSSPTASGTYAPVANATSPYEVTPAATGATFYRVKQ